MAKVKALRNVIIEGTPVEAGKVAECSEKVAKYLVAIGKAELVVAKKAAGKETAEAGPSEVADAPEAKKAGSK